VRTAGDEAAGAHDQCSANAVSNAVAASQAGAVDAGPQQPGTTADSSSAAGPGTPGTSSATSSAPAPGNGSGNGSGASTGAANSSSGNGSNGATPSAMPWTYGYMLFILPRQYTGWSYTEVGRCKVTSQYHITKLSCSSLPIHHLVRSHASVYLMLTSTLDSR
jgi:hypothetical protein